ncbi:hypothetical protein GCM10022284_74060 [Streptomyces hundungensis]
MRRSAATARGRMRAPPGSPEDKAPPDAQFWPHNRFCPDGGLRPHDGLRPHNEKIPPP